MSTVTFQGKPLTLEGTLVSVGNEAPDFSVVDGALAPKTLADYAGKVKVITTFPSIDTSVCDAQIREFNKRATALGDAIVILGVSKDLPFAQQRFCGAAGITGVTLLSDYQTTSLGKNYGVSIKELCLLARTVIIVDATDTVRYVELVSEVTEQPDYDAAIKVLQELCENRG